MASSLLERPWCKKGLKERSDSRILLVKHPQNGTREAIAEQHYPRYQRTLEDVDFQGFFFLGVKTA